MIHQDISYRRHPRFKLFYPIEYTVGNRVLKDFIRDISINGVYIHTHSSIPLGKQTTMILSLPDNSVPLKIGGRIVRLESDGIGVKFQKVVTELQNLQPQFISSEGTIMDKGTILQMRKQFTSEEKLVILKSHLIDKKPISQLCRKYQFHPDQFYQWQKIFFDKGSRAFNSIRQTV